MIRLCGNIRNMGCIDLLGNMLKSVKCRNSARPMMKIDGYKTKGGEIEVKMVI